MPRTPGAERSNRDDATTNPTSSNDETEGWDVGSRWINTINGTVWFAVDVSTGAAVWKDVSASASGSHPVTIDVVDPTVTDDSNSGYAIGDHWINTANQTIWQAVDVSVGAAVWERVDGPKRNVTTVDPTVSNDNTEGYEIGSAWVNTSSTPPRVFVATDVSTGAAVWERTTNVRGNATGSDPTVGDDSADGYEIGSLWINTTDQRYWVAFDVSVGAAVWERIDQPRRNITTTDPTVSDDNTQGYEIGSTWINTASSPPKVYRAVDVSTGAAVWERVSNFRSNATGANPTVSNDNTQGYEIGSWWVNTSTGRVFRATDVSTGAAVWATSVPRGGMEARNNLSASVDPLVTDDSNFDYSIGSVWVNTAVSPRRVFVCADSSVGSAIWIQTTNTIDNPDSPGSYFLGSILDYSIEGGLTAGEIQYSRVFLLAGLTITSIEVFIGSGGTVGREARAGLYSQAVPTSSTGVPVTRVAQSNSLTTETANGSYFNLPLTTPYDIPTTGYYWVAIVADSASLKFVVTNTVYRQDYPPTYRESSTGTTLPATAGTITNPVSAIAYAAATI